MVTAIVLLKISKRHINEVAEKLADIKGISEVYSVSGNFDVVAMVRVKDNEALSELVTDKLAQIEPIEKTETMLAFRAYSKLDLEAMFEVGL